MDPLPYWFRVTFHNQWLIRRGVEFQSLFENIMQNAHPDDFMAIKPYGPKGDSKCDGYLSSQRCVFQCYAPERMIEKQVIRKIKADFAGAVDSWGKKMGKWVFVHNFNGKLTADTAQILKELDTEHPEVAVSAWGFHKLLEEVRRMPADALAECFGYPPTTAEIDRLEFDTLQPALDAIARGCPDLDISLASPPSVTKIEKNELDDDAIAFLQMGRRRVQLVEEYFDQHPDPNLGDKIAQAFRIQYQALRDHGFGPQEVLYELQKFSGLGKGSAPSHEAAVLAVLMYFFDRCDIFEDPDDEPPDLKIPEQ